MAVTVYQLQAVIQQPPFRQRIEQALVTIAENISTEATNTPLHAQRKAIAAQIMNDPDAYVTKFATGVVAQLSLSTTNMVTVNGVPGADVDTTDAALQTTISAIFNDYFV